MQNLTKFVHLKIYIFIKKWLTQNMWHIGAIVNIININLQSWILFGPECKFIIIQRVDICEETWYKVVGLARSTYKVYTVQVGKSTWVSIFVAWKQRDQKQ